MAEEKETPVNIAAEEIAGGVYTFLGDRFPGFKSGIDKWSGYSYGEPILSVTVGAGLATITAACSIRRPEVNNLVRITNKIKVHYDQYMIDLMEPDAFDWLERLVQALRDDHADHLRRLFYQTRESTWPYGTLYFPAS